MVGVSLLATAGVLGTTGIPQYFAQKRAADKAQDAQEEANRVSRASAQVENARRRRQAIAQARIAQAQNTAAQGEQVQSSSALSGVQSSLSTQLGANIGAQQQRVRSQQRIQDLNQSAANALQQGREQAALWNAAGQTFQTVTGALSGGASFGGGQAAGAGTVNMQGQASPLYNNSAFVSRF